MNTFVIPLTNVPQQFQITLATITYVMSCKWNNSPDAGWILDISDATGNPIIGNIPLVTGADLLAQLEYLGIGGSLYVNNGTDATAIPTLDNLGSGCLLYFQTGAASV